MKRTASLISFSHDHHHALAEARRLVLASDGDHSTRRAATHTFLQFFTHETLSHFDDEEQRLFPCASDSVDGELHAAIATALAEHDVLRAHCAQLQKLDERGEAPDASLLAEVGELLTAHVRYEERVVFDLLQRHVSTQTLDASVGDRVSVDTHPQAPEA